MRSLLPFFVLLAACSQGQEPTTTLATGTFAGEGRDRLCIAGEAGNYRGGFIAYAAGDVNCSASGKIESGNGNVMLIPRGEGDCRIQISIEGGVARIAAVPDACSYYCGPGASIAGKSFSRAEKASPAVDLAGDPLC